MVLPAARFRLSFNFLALTCVVDCHQVEKVDVPLRLSQLNVQPPPEVPGLVGIACQSALCLDHPCRAVNYLVSHFSGQRSTATMFEPAEPLFS